MKHFIGIIVSAALLAGSAFVLWFVATDDKRRARHTPPEPYLKCGYCDARFYGATVEERTNAYLDHVMQEAS